MNRLKLASIVAGILMGWGTIALGQAMSGTYTIGGLNGQYPTLTEAVNALKLKGVSGPVVFKIRAGNYVEPPLQIPLITGVSPTNSVTFESETGVTESVVIIGSAMYSPNYAIQLNGAKHIIFHKVKVWHQGAAFSHAFSLTGSSMYNTIRNCVILMDTANKNYNSGRYPISIFNGTGNVVENCTIIGGDRGLNLSGPAIETVIRNNTIKEVDETGIYVYQNIRCKIVGNKISFLTHGNGPGSTTAGVHTYQCTNVSDISGNLIKGFQQGLYLFDFKTDTGAITVSNNMVISQPGGLSSTGGLVLNRVKNMDVFHNSVVSLGGPALFLGGSSGATFISENLRMVNNIFQHNGTGLVYQLYSLLPILEWDYNCLYTNGAALARINNVDVPNLDQLRATSGKEKKSFFTHTIFLSNNSLHVNKGHLDGKALRLDKITEDYDGEVRSPFNPDIGADEFILGNVDIAIGRIFPERILEPGENKISAILVNNGKKSLKDSTVELGYSLDSGLTWIAKESYKIPTLENTYDTLTYRFGQKLSHSGNGTYNFCVQVISPGLLADTLKNNDMLCQSLCTGVQGSITVGAAGKHFKTIKEAIQYLQSNTCGLSGPVTIFVDPGTYLGRLKFTGIAGLSAERSLTLTSSSGNNTDVVILADGPPSNVPLIQIEKTSHVVLKDLTLMYPDSAQSSTVHIDELSSHIQVSSCRMLGDSNKILGGSSGILLGNVNSAKALARNCVFSGNVFAGLDLGISSYGNSLDSLCRDLLIAENVFRGMGKVGILLNHIHNVQVRDNEISFRSDIQDGIALSAFGLSGRLLVERNWIRKTSNVGFYLENSSLYAGSMLSNNMIGGGFKNPYLSYGLYLVSVKKLLVAYNSVMLDNPQAAESYALVIHQSSELELLNNNFINLGKGYALWVADTTAVQRCDYNNWYTSGNKFIYWNGDKSHLQDHKAKSAQDAHSISVLPGMVSNEDLHLTGAELDQMGTPIAGILLDIDKQPRDPDRPDIGCDEFNVGLDAALAKWVNPRHNARVKGDQELKIEITNMGNVVLDSVPVGITVNKKPYGTGTLSSSLNPGQTKELSLGFSWRDTTYGTYTLCAFTMVSGDVALVNDTACITVYRDSLTGLLISPSLMAPILFPNPTRDVVYLNPALQAQQVIFLDQRGRKVLQWVAPEEEGYSVQSLAPGLYHVLIHSQGGYYTGQLIIAEQ